MAETYIEREPVVTRTQTFKKCDLHVHSCSCYSRSYAKDKFMERALTSDLDVIAVTDHNTVDTDLMEELNTALTAKNKILIVGAEVNVKLKPETIERHELVLGKGEKGDYFHGIIWCAYNDCLKLGQAVDKLFCAEGIISQSDLDNVNKKKITRKELSKMTEGKSVFLENMQDELCSIPHFFVFHENKGSRNLTDYLPNAKDGKTLNKNQEYKQKLFYYCHAMAVEGGETSRRGVSAYFKEQLNETLAALFFSDANVLFPEDVKHKDDIVLGERYTWIDFDGDLDSLLLAISDPASRVRTSDICFDNPQVNRNNYLESLAFDLLSDGGTKRVAQSLNFAPGFNGIVGARGSGKSMLARVLANRDLEDYSSFVDPNSIKYTVSNGQPTSNPPKFIYLKQGELEGIFKNEKYSEVPFLKNRLQKIEAEAAEVSDKAFNEIKKQLEMQNELAIAFVEKYSSGIVSADTLDSDPPSGLLVEFPNLSITMDSQTADKMKESLDDVCTQLHANIELLDKVKPKSDNPENVELFSAFSSEIEKAKNQVEQAALRLSEITAAANKIKDNWFVERELLATSFISEIDQFNDQQDSMALAKYTKSLNTIVLFFEHLLRMQLLIKESDSIIKEHFKTMLTPISPVEVEIEEEKFRVIISYDGCTSYENATNGLLSNASRNYGNHIARLCLASGEVAKVKTLLNGQRIKKQPDWTFKEYINKYFSCLTADIAAGKELKRNVILNEKSLDDMSPGMRAEALLKLFLQDDLTENECVFVVLDQPEDNLDTDTISRFLIKRLKQLKSKVQFFIVSHSAPVIVNGDARNVIICKAFENEIEYSFGAINGATTKQAISTVLDGGERYLKMRLNKYNFQVGDER